MSFGLYAGLKFFLSKLLSSSCDQNCFCFYYLFILKFLILIVVDFILRCWVWNDASGLPIQIYYIYIVVCSLGGLICVSILYILLFYYFCIILTQCPHRLAFIVSCVVFTCCIYLFLYIFSLFLYIFFFLTRSILSGGVFRSCLDLNVFIVKRLFLLIRFEYTVKTCSLLMILYVMSLDKIL